MTNPHADPGYGDPLAPIGSEDWAKRWRLGFQNVAKRLPDAPGRSKKYYELGLQHRAWSLLTDADGKVFSDFDTFCSCEQPWGLGMDPIKFRAYLKAELGDKQADLITVAPSQQGERTDLEETSRDECGKSGSRKQEALRAILRAPEVVQELYREGLVTQTVAAKMGPQSPTPEKAAQIAEARQEIEKVSRTQKKAEVRKEVAGIVTRVLGVKTRTPLDHLRDWWGKASTEERSAFLSWTAQEGGAT